MLVVLDVVVVDLVVVIFVVAVAATCACGCSDKHSFFVNMRLAAATGQILATIHTHPSKTKGPLRALSGPFVLLGCV